MFSLRNFGILGSTLALGLVLHPAFAASHSYTYLALGDSISFGLDPTLLPTMAGQPVPPPTKFVGYPEVIASVDSRFNRELNGSCPGETSGSFIDTNEPDNGCNHTGPTGQGPYRPDGKLHAKYEGAQLDFALSQLSANKGIELVTLSIGANDALIAVANCAIAGGDVPTCVGTQLPIALGNYAQNLTTILAKIRVDYKGTIVLVNSYSPSPDLNPVAGALNDVTAQVGSVFGAKIADGFAAFQFASAYTGGDVCKAGLLIKKTDGSCDQHPSRLGQDVLAAAVEIALAKR
jgi:lysophospholipase L1-like esterase